MFATARENTSIRLSRMASHKHEVYNIKTGEVVGDMDAGEAAEFAAGKLK